MFMALSPIALGQQNLNRPSSKPQFSFGAVSDCQYCDHPTRKNRHYRASTKKLTECVDHLNTMKLRYVVHLGDFIDRDFKSFDVVGPIFGRLKAEQRHVLGNHDFEVADKYKAKVPGRLGLKSRYYDFEENDWRFIVLDTNDISLYAYPKNTRKYLASKKYLANLKAKNNGRKNLVDYNGAVGPRQLSWLKLRLKKAADAKQKVIVYSHHPVFPPNRHNVWNDTEVIEILESHTNVKAYINGHNHGGNYGKKNNIHYLTLKGMVDTEKNSYAKIDVHRDRLIVKGVGREKNRELIFQKTLPTKKPKR